MSQEVRQTKLGEQTQQLLEGPLKHVRAAALAAALLPLASVAAAPAAAQDCSPSSGGTVCGFVWSDTNNNGVQDSGEVGIPGATVTLSLPSGPVTYTTGGDGFYYFYDVPTGDYQIVVDDNQDGTQASPPGIITNPPNPVGEPADSDGTPSGTTSSAQVTVPPGNGVIVDLDFGFTPSPQSSDGEVPSPCDFLTSGGFVIGDAGKKVTFGIHGGCKHGEFWGHLNVVDHETGYHINSTDVTAYLVPTGATANVREICGLATTNKSTDPSSVMFRVRLIDNGEPGSADLMGIRLSTGYHVSTRLLSDIKPGGGNIQLHDPNPSTDELPSSLQCWGVPSPDTQ